MVRDCVVAVDQGTSGTTALVVSRAGEVLGRAHAEFSQHYPRPGWVEHDAVEIWEVTRGVMEAVLRRVRTDPARVAGIGITNQRETTVLWDRESSRPVAPAIVWQDRRTAKRCEALRAQGLEETWQGRTGLLIDPYFSATKVAWLLESLPGLRDAAAAGAIAFGTIDSWLVWNLTGGSRHVTDCSNASRTMLYNIHDLGWDADILATLGIPASMLPEVVSSSGVIGETHPAAFFGHRVPIAGIAGDQQAALFGQACRGQGLAKNTYGTGSFLMMHTGRRPVASSQRLLTTIAWRLGGDATEYALEGAIFVTGAAIQWLRDGLGILAEASESEALAASLDGNEGVLFVPALAGLGAPYWDPHARGMLIGLTRGTTRAHIARAALEAIAYQTRDVAEAMVRDSGLALRELRVDGGAVQNRFLMQFQADILGVPVVVPAITETTALGAAYLAGLGSGLWASREELDAGWREAERYVPAMAKGERDRLYSVWQEAVKRCRGWAAEDEA
ncbi:MAG: glycerol kinase GlpK [Lentisphaeria bacterium]|nr:glycerol kinase GlpK [Lentisphaeria bacterium]